MVVIEDVVNLSAAGGLNKDGAAQTLGHGVDAGSCDVTVLFLPSLTAHRLTKQVLKFGQSDAITFPPLCTSHSFTMRKPALIKGINTGTILMDQTI